MQSEGIQLDEVEDSVDLVLLNAWPKHRRMAPLTFEVWSEKIKYDEMENNMDRYYADLQHRVRLTDDKIEIGMHVIYGQKIGKREGYTFKRAKILKEIKPKIGEGSDTPYPFSKVQIDLIDYGVTMDVFTYELQIMNDQFEVLPPRVFMLENKLGLGTYKNTSVYKRLINRYSGLFDGPLVVQRLNAFSESLVVYSSVCPVSTHPYGINGYIMKRFAWEYSKHKLPPINEEKNDAYITHALITGELYVRFSSKFLSHYLKIMQCCLTSESYKAYCGKVCLPIRPSQILLGARKSTGKYARCVCIEQMQTSSKTIKVQFIDYGELDYIPISTTLFARDINVLLELIPPLANAARLYGVTTLGKSKRKAFTTDKKPCTVKTRNILPCGTHEVSIVVYERENEKLYRKTVLCEEMGESACEEDKKQEVQEKCKLWCETPYCTISMDSLDVNGDGSECLFYRKNTEIDLAVCGWDDDETILAHPASMRERLVLLERQLNKVYSYSWNAVRSADSLDGKIFAIVAPLYNRVVRCKVVAPLKNHLDKVEVLLVDYGTTIEVLRKNLRTIEFDHTLMPALGCKVTLFEKEKDLPIKRMKNFRTRMKVDYFKGIVSDITYKTNGVLLLAVTFIEGFGKNLDYKVAWDEW